MISLLRSQHPAFRYFADTLYPPLCATCDKTLTRIKNASGSSKGNKLVNTYAYLRHSLICRNCLTSLDSQRIMYENFAHCESCGFKCETSDNAPLCLKCSERRPYPILRIRSLYQYHGNARILIHLMKYKERIEIANLLALSIYKSIPEIFLPGSLTHGGQGNHAALGWDSIIGIPSHRKNVLRRGFYSTQYLTQKISKFLGVKTNEYYLETLSTKIEPRSWLPAKRRLEEEIPLFQLKHKSNKRSQSLKSKRILLLDDVITTGTTLIGAIRALSKEEPARIDVISLAQSRSFQKLYLQKNSTNDKKK